MKLIETLTGKLTTRVEDKLRTAEDRLAGFDAQREEFALAAAMDTPGAGEKLGALEKQIATARNEVDRLRSAMRLAVEKDERAEADARRRLRESQFAAMRAHADARLKATREMVIGMEAAATAYRRYIGATLKMTAAVPIGTSMPPGAQLGYLESEIASELYRHSGVTQIGARGAFPGAKPPSELMRFQPDQIRPLTDVIEDANNYILTSIRGQTFGEEIPAAAEQGA
jgi:hypothetical protein